MSIRNKIVLCLLAALFPLAAVGTFAIHLITQQVEERTTAALVSTQRLEALRIEQLLEGYTNSTRSLASRTRVRTLVSQVYEYHKNKAADPDFRQQYRPTIGGSGQFAIVDPEAPWPLQQLALALQKRARFEGSSIVELRIVNRNNEVMGESIGFTWAPVDNTLIERSMATDQTLLGDVFVNEEGREYLGIASPIVDRSGDAVGALIVEAKLTPIINMISRHEQMGSSSESYIAQATIEGDAQFITPLRYDHTAAFNRIVPKESDLTVNKALRSQESQIIRSLDYRGVESFLAIQTIAPTGWGLVFKVDTAEIYAPAIQLHKWLLWATAASIGFVALVYLFLLIPIVSRLNKAASAARQIMDGTLTARVDVTSNDEITELASSINSLARDLETDQKKRIGVEAQLRYQAAHDGLTGLPNRKHANQVIEQLTRDDPLEHSVMFLDLNDFKQINDLYGHITGDQVLSKVAQRLANQMPQGATLARWGGDEFVVILPDVDHDEATELALTLHNVFIEPVKSDISQHSITCSIGLATSSLEKSLDESIVEADVLMYAQKKKHQRALAAKTELTT